MKFVSPGPFEIDGGSILVRCPNWIGDAVIATASLRSIRRSFRDSCISVLAKPWVIPVLAHNPDIDEIIVYDGKGRHRGMRGRLRLVRYLRTRRFQGAILLQRAFEAAVLARLAGIPNRMGYTTDARGFLLTHKARSSREEFDILRLEHDLKLLEGFGLKVPERKVCIPIRREQKGRAERRLRELGFGMGGALVGFSPGAVGSVLKRWYPERFAELAVRIVDAFEAKVLLFGSPNEGETGEEICRLASNRGVANLAGHTSLEEAITLIGACCLFVTNDSGLMHVAAALDVPVVGVFGPTDPRRTAPWSKRYLLVRDPGVDCCGCKMRKCSEGHKCMDRVTVDRVFRGVEEIVGRYGMEPARTRMDQLTVAQRTVPVVTAD